MEFWGAEVKAGKPLTVKPEEGNLIHVSQASLDCKGKKGECVLLFVNVDGKKLVIGTLSQDNIPQISFDLVFEKEFELSHNCDKGSVHFVGYKSPNIDDQEEGDDFYDSGESEDEEVPTTVTANGNSGAAALNVPKADSKPKAKPVEVKPAEVKPVSEDGDDSDEEDESDEDDGSDSEKGMDVDEDDSDDEDDSEDEEEETPKKPEPINKKRANESASKTPVSAKKAKPATTPQKTEEKKKGGHTATPHPAKKGGKSPVNANQSPKSGGQSSAAGSNKKQFNSGNKQFGGSNNKGKGKRRA